MILMRANSLLRPLEGVGFTRCHFRAPKSLDVQGPALPMAILMDVTHIITPLRPLPFKH
jgi:hypothetical protein